MIESTGEYNIIGVVDIKQNIGQSVLGYKVIGCDDDLQDILSICNNAVVTIGHVTTNNLRKNVYIKLKQLGFCLPVIVSPRAYVSRHSSVAQGTIVMHDALINSNVSIGENCIINTKALVEHDSVIENHCHISTSSVINGTVRVKEDSFFGSNSVSNNNTEVNGFVKAGRVVK
ncbi:acetyltransferase [Francisella philomiragia]|uniref:PglD-related sugar-binding protein n=1 Tax=Francisella philomiragia TaxID=28110 RepID=UPI001F20C89B|nr:acetyltransferase [Francisella philomiragia]